MSQVFAERVISIFKLTGGQKDAALERKRDVVVTAGAGSGKTRTLVARYASLLAEGLTPRRVVAITFTEKAAREMRSRVRDALVELIAQAETDDERKTWLDLNAQMDAARIGTIHSLCAEILRNHPAEAGIDPRFDVLDEGLSAALKARVVTDTLNDFVDRPEFAPFFEIIGPTGLHDLLAFMLNRRLEVGEALASPPDGIALVRQRLEKAFRDSELADIISELRAMSPDSLLENGQAQLLDLLTLWKSAEQALAQGNLGECAALLAKARGAKMNKQGGRKSEAKELLYALRDSYERLLESLINKGNPPSQESEERFAALLPLLPQVYACLESSYAEQLRQRQALDFDDLESGAQRLLGREGIRVRWQAELDALLVDEFQDTNARQREIVEALAGSPGRLFVVGDARQSIYRFRRADVTVFRAIQSRVKAEGGLVVELNRTYRAHDPLLAVTGDVLGGIMGTEEDPARPYHVAFSALEAARSTPQKLTQPPHLELVLGVGDDAESARPQAAQALAARLLELKDKGQIQSWDEVALLFRASTGFAHYENAFEQAGIPFMTVAGRGFYDRP
jgi:ATP-dependent helicase/nuclease subunit A